MRRSSATDAPVATIATGAANATGEPRAAAQGALPDRVVERDAGHDEHGDREATRGGDRCRGGGAVGRDHLDAGDPLAGPEEVRQDSDLLQRRDGARGEGIPARLVAREARLVDEHDPRAARSQEVRRRGPARAGPHDDDIAPKLQPGTPLSSGPARADAP